MPKEGVFKAHHIKQPSHVHLLVKRNNFFSLVFSTKQVTREIHATKVTCEQNKNNNSNKLVYMCMLQKNI